MSLAATRTPAGRPSTMAVRRGPGESPAGRQLGEVPLLFGVVFARSAFAGFGRRLAVPDEHVGGRLFLVDGGLAARGPERAYGVPRRPDGHEYAAVGRDMRLVREAQVSVNEGGRRAGGRCRPKGYGFALLYLGLLVFQGRYFRP